MISYYILQYDDHCGHIILIIRTEGLDGMFESQFTCCPTHFCTKYDICDTVAAEETAEKKQNFDEA